jgi:hypothetical protein
MIRLTVIRLLCPTGCGSIPRPVPLRSSPVRCSNCTAWLSAPPCEDGSLVEAVLLARPGERLASARPAPFPWRYLVAAAAVIALCAAFFAR